MGYGRIAGLMVVALPLLAGAWGSGHDTVARALAARLPPPWNERVRGEALKTFCSDNHWPDSFEQIPAERAGAEAVAYLAERKITKRYDFHSDRGRAEAFCLLVRALREEQHGRALLWLAALAHSTADMAACNHDPVVHVATYGWCDAAWGLSLPGGKSFAGVTAGLDLSWVEKHAWAQAVFERQVDAAMLRDGGAEAGAALLEIMLYGVGGVEACAPHGPRVLEAAAEWTDTGRREAGERLAEELSMLGAWAVARTLRDFHAALRLARSGELPEVTPALLSRYETAVDGFVKKRDLAADLFAQAALAPSGVKGARVGVVIEPCWRMDEGVFGFGDRVLAVQAVNTLRRRGRNAELVDVRRLLETGAAAKAVPTLLIPAQRCGSYRTLKAEELNRQLAAYLDNGGRIVWIGGGRPPAALCRGMPKDFLVKGEDKAWPVVFETFTNGALKIGGTLNAQSATFACVNPPQGKAGWHWPRNPHVFSREALAAGQMFVGWTDGAGPDKPVGMAWPKEKPSVAYAPGYAVLPCVWTRETPMLYPLRLELDEAGVRVLEAALESLGL